jgi:hypothetical protein
LLEDRRLFLSVSVEDQACSLKDSLPILLTPLARGVTHKWSDGWKQKEEKKNFEKRLDVLSSRAL